MQTVVTDKWILCPVCRANTRTQILDDTELKRFPLFCPKCKESGIISGNIMLVIFATIFAPCHIRISYMNAVYKGDN